jgi:uncharacterized protein (TIGR02001 family)
MARDREVGVIKSCVLAAALVAGLALSAQADEKKLTLSATTVFTTDYIFRGLSQTSNGPAVQPEFDVYYGMFYAGIWGSNVDFQEGIEIDYYVGMAPKWGNFTFDIAGLAYTYPGSNDPELDYFELKSGVTWASGQWSLRVTNYWSPNNFNSLGDSDAIEGAVAYSFQRKLFNFFTPTVSGLVGYQAYEDIADYTYWNAGLTLGFMEHWSADVRYWDTTYDGGECFINTGVRSACDERVVGTFKAVF